MSRIISMLTMKFKGYAFYDTVANRPVSYYEDKYGQQWMSFYPYYLFRHRVKSNNYEQ